MNRFRASGLHLAISACIAASVFLGVFFVWYPDALFERAGGKELFMLIAAVDVTIGPTITLIIYKKGKKGLKFDLVAIALAQLSALVFGTWVLYESRPAYLVFIKDRFELARANEIEPAELAKARSPYDRLPISGPRIVGANLPTDPDEQFRIMMSAAGGLDIQGYPQYFTAYDNVRGDAVMRSAPFADLRKYNDGEAVSALARRLGGNEGKLRILPIRAGKVDLTAIIDGTSADVVYISGLAPWEFK